MSEKEKMQMMYDAGKQDGIILASMIWAILTGVILMAAFL